MIKISPSGYLYLSYIYQNLFIQKNWLPIFTPTKNLILFAIHWLKLLIYVMPKLKLFNMLIDKLVVLFYSLQFTNIEQLNYIISKGL